jgi:hypothetical protein
LTSSVAVFVDGDNLASVHAPQILRIANSFGAARILRVFGGEGGLRNWAQAYAFEQMYCGPAKNATDMHMTVDAIQTALTHPMDVAVLCTSDSDFTPLARWLRARGVHVAGCGEDKTHVAYRKSCTDFHVLALREVPAETACPPAAGTVAQAVTKKVRAVITEHGTAPRGLRITDLNGHMRRSHNFNISALPEKTWREYLCKRPDQFDVDPRGPEACVRLRAAQP